MGDVVVITHDASVVTWAATVARAEGSVGTRLMLEPVVLRLTLAEVERLLATGRPELAVFAVWAVHDQRGREAQDVCAPPSRRSRRRPTRRCAWRCRAMISMLGEPLLAALREMPINPLTIPESPGYKAPRREIKAIGEARALARALLRVLERRGVTLDEATRTRVTECTDTAVLDGWLDRAATASARADVFDA